MTQLAPKTPSFARGFLGTLVAMVLLLCIIGIAVLGSDVRRSVATQASASSDNTQWTLAQIDVEFLVFRDAVLAVNHQQGPLSELRKRFDILYSRSTTLMEGDIFAGLMTDPEYRSGILATRTFLDRIAPLIDGDDAALLAALPRIEAQISALRPRVKKIALAGIRVFAEISDAERRSVANTLIAVGALTAVMIVVLLGLVAVLLRLDFVNRAHARALMLSLARTESIVSTALDAVVAIDIKGRIIAFNPAAEKVFGYSRDEALGADMAELLIPDPLRPAHAAGMQRAYLQNRFVFTGRGRLRLSAKRKDGTVFPIEMSVAKSEDKTGAIFVAFLRDLSAEVAAERELMQARDDALAGEKAKADLLAVMSHEMRTPLNGMLGMLELMEDTDLKPRQREFLAVMQTSGRLLLHHVNDVLSIARLESGKMPVQSVAVDLAALVHEIFANQSATSSAHGTSLLFRLQDSTPTLMTCDLFQLRQILLNLIGNAIKFTHNGDVTVELAYAAPQAMMEFRVIDSGIGIPEADLERIFEDFVTLDATYARSTGGTGLGLGITRRIVQNLGGSITAESMPGKGSLFRVRLPMHPAPALAVPAPLPARAQPMPLALAAAPPNRLRILVVEDNPINRMVVREMLQRQGHLVQEAYDGDEGVRLASVGQFDVILMDISMPRLDGVAATRAIRAGNGLSKTVPIIALTAHALAAEVARFRLAGMQNVLIKPVTGKALAQMLDRFALSETAIAMRFDSPPSADLIDSETITDLFEALGPERARRLMRSFLEQAEDALETLGSETQAQASVEALRGDIHKLCGSAAMFGASALSLRLRGLEELCHAGDVSAVLVQLPDLQPIWHATRAELAGFLVAEAENP